MSESEIANLITYINAIDPRVVIDDHKVIAWKRVLNPHIAFTIAQEMVDKHYKNTSDTIMPSDINSLYQRGRSLPVFTSIDAPKTPVDHEWRKIVAADVKAKLKMEKGKTYSPEIVETYTDKIEFQGETNLVQKQDAGMKWDFPVGTGQYATAAGVDVFGEDLVWEAKEIPE